MSKVIYKDTETDRQIIIEVGPKEKLASYIEVLWDERSDGPLDARDEANLGGLVREQDGSLSLDQAELDSANQVKADAASARDSRQAKIDRVKAGTASTRDMQELLGELF